MEHRITLVSIGRHTRLGDVLEQALEGVSFRTMDIEEIADESTAQKRLLFAASADGCGENESMRRLTARLLRGECRLDGAVCALISDGEPGGAIQTDALKLLLAANRAGALCASQPLLESGRDLKRFSKLGGKARVTPFDAYTAQAKALIKRLSDVEVEWPEQPRFRVVSPLAGGTAQDWRAVLARFVSEFGGKLTEEANAEGTILLAENTDGLPDERTLALLKRGSGRLTCFVASPAIGGELYTLALLDQACVRGGYLLAPEGMLVFEGMSTVEAFASKVELERVKAGIRRVF